MVVPVCACAGCAWTALKTPLKTAPSPGSGKKKQVTKIQSNLYTQGLQTEAITNQM